MLFNFYVVKSFKGLKLFSIVLLIFGSTLIYGQTWYLPVDATNRQFINNIQLTHIGDFGHTRQERPLVKAHLHTGVDIMRPNKNYDNEKIYPACVGLVISIRTDGPYAEIILEHRISDNKKIWTVYQHLSRILVKPGQVVYPEQAMAFFMTKTELNKYGWQFDHVHFEIMKYQPLKLTPYKQNPQRKFGTYSLVCYNRNDLEKYYFAPLEFLAKKFSGRNED